jgi:AcrR family transcriptional regulator
MNPKAQQIVNQVRILYQRYGIKSVTMDDAANHLGISKKTLYEHFTDKEDLVSAILTDDLEQSCTVIDAIEGRALNAIEDLFEVYKMLYTWYRDYNPSMIYDVRKYYPGLFTRIRKMRRERIMSSAIANLEKGKREGLYRVELNSEILAKLHILRIESLYDNDIFTMEEILSLAMMDEVFVYHLHGILSHEGRLFFESNFGKFRANL